MALLAVICPVLTNGRGIPQARRVYRTGAEGVSLLTWMMWLGLSELWTAYGFLFHIPAEVVTNVGTTLNAVVVLLLIARAKDGKLMGLIGVLAVSAAAGGLIVIGAVYKPGIVALVAVSGSIGLYLPQVAKVFTSEVLAGVSVATWWLAILTAAAWLIYGILLSQLPVYLPTLVMIPASTAIIWRIHRVSAQASEGVGSTPLAQSPIAG